MTDQEPTFAARIAAVMAGIKRLEKSERNKHGGYNFVSVDNVKDQIRPLLASNGLFLSVSETDFQISEIPNSKGGMTTTARITFCITLSDGAEHRSDNITVMLPYTGAQTAGAARSYAVKEWAKGTLLVSTGEDVDADHSPQDDYGRSNQNQSYNQSRQEAAPKPKEDPRDIHDRLVKALDTCTSPAELNTEKQTIGFVRDYNTLAKVYPESGFAEAVADHAKKRASFLAQAQAPASNAV